MCACHCTGEVCGDDGMANACGVCWYMCQFPIEPAVKVVGGRSVVGQQVAVLTTSLPAFDCPDSVEGVASRVGSTKACRRCARSALVPRSPSCVDVVDMASMVAKLYGQVRLLG